MPLGSYENIFLQFPPSSPEEWKHKIMSDLKGEPIDKISIHTREGIDILPFYTREDNKKYQLDIPQKTNNSWLITERITVNDISSANLNALQALKMGSNAIIFDLQNRSLKTNEIKDLLKDILLDIAVVYFENYIAGNKDELESVVKESCTKKIIIPKQETITEELVFALQHATDNNLNVTHFHFFTCTDYFFEIAKLRAFRWLWKQLCELNSIPYNIFIISETVVLHDKEKEEYNNILRNTTEAMSAILGGCDALIVNSHDKNETGFSRRLARNIHHILLHESYFDEINDAAKGSYYIEYLTYQFAQKAWELVSLKKTR
ncbi:MAG: mutA [Bacteroidota bacterium]|nr:mutA [Bacteroidota bacterium]